MSRQHMIDVFLQEILRNVRTRDGHRITELIQLDFENMPSSQQKPYSDLNIELNSRFPRGNDAGLSKHCKDALPQNELGSFHSAFSESVIQYFRYLRDFTTADNQSKAYEIRQLTSQCITALGDSKYGVIMIPIVLSFSRVLAMIAANLDRNPALLQQTSTAATSADEPGGSKVSFVESTANVLRDAFIKCLAGSPGSQRTTKPHPNDKRYGIYLTANSCLKLLWQCRKLRNAQQMFLSIDAQSPPLSFYPAAQRVTFLYYLGRYHLANNHFYRAQLTLQSAYDQCHRQAVKHRRLILTYLMAANVCLGRFPSSHLFSRPEAAEMARHFQPLCMLIRSGDVAAVEQYLDSSRGGISAQWFLQKRILLQLRDRCETLVWRSLVRKVFVICGFKGEDRKIPFLRLAYVEAAARWSWIRAYTINPGSTSYVDSEFEDFDKAINETGFDTDTGRYHDDGASQDVATKTSYGSAGKDRSPTMYEVESIILSLVQQGFLRGFVQHTPGNPRFAIPGSQAAGGPVPKGFPDVWDVVVSKAMDANGDTIPGWVKDDMLSGGTMRSGTANLGGIVRLSGARAVGVGS